VSNSNNQIFIAPYASYRGAERALQSALEEVGIDPWVTRKQLFGGGGRDKTVGFNPTTPTAIQTLESAYISSS